MVITDPINHRGKTVYCFTVSPFTLSSMDYYTYRPGDAFMAKVDKQGIVRQLVMEEEIPDGCVRIFEVVGEERSETVVRVMVVRGKARASQDFTNEDLGRLFYQKAKKRFGEENTYLISLTRSIPAPMDYKPKVFQKIFWCPYCGAERRFKHDSFVDAERCSICGVSDRDFYVRKYNNLWPSISEKKSFRGNSNMAGLTKAEKRKLRRQKRKEAQLNGGDSD